MEGIEAKGYIGSRLYPVSSTEKNPKGYLLVVPSTCGHLHGTLPRSPSGACEQLLTLFQVILPREVNPATTKRPTKKVK